MPDKTKTVVIIESHEQTIIRRSRRVISSQLPGQGDVSQPDAVLTTSALAGCSIGSASSDATERLAKSERRWLAAWWRTVALKGVTVFAPWSRRLKLVGNRWSNKKP
jgi:hypothetical protein